MSEKLLEQGSGLWVRGCIPCTDGTVLEGWLSKGYYLLRHIAKHPSAQAVCDEVEVILHGYVQEHWCPNPDWVATLHLQCLRPSGSFPSWLPSVASSWGGDPGTRPSVLNWRTEA